MPVSLSARATKTKQITVDLGDGESFDMWYRPGSVTPKSIRELVAAAKADDDESGFAVVLDQIRRFVSQWDVLDDEGQRIPPTSEMVETFDVSMLKAAVNAIKEDLEPKPTNSTNSGSFS